ncbi:MAG: DUF1778 domain-containing protein [Magnetococcales bacterium]|nr:DUF1778 domain-containing protein [Magnetococcales bacterium]
MLAVLPQRSPQEIIEFCVRPEEKGLIDRAAQMVGQTRDEFIRSAVRQAATDVILDCTHIVVSQEEHDACLAIFDAPPQPNERLCRTLQTPAPWEQ